MIFSSFSSLIELFAALYLTICLDDLLLRRFWTIDYAQKVESKFSSIKIPPLAKKQVTDEANKLSSEEEKRSRKRGAIMFGMSIILLIIIGFEDTFLKYGTPILSTSFSIIAVYFLIHYIWDGKLLKSWWKVLEIIIIGALLFSICVFGAARSNQISNYINTKLAFFDLGAQILLVITLVVPILWQLFRNWLYSSYYLDYIFDLASEKAADYNIAITFDVKKIKMTKVAVDYQDIVSVDVASGNQDRQITQYLEVLQKNLSSISYIPTVDDLLKHSLQIHKKKNLSNKQLKKLYNEYISLSPVPKMLDFCTNKGIQYEIFHDFYLKQPRQVTKKKK